MVDHTQYIQKTNIKINAISCNYSMFMIRGVAARARSVRFDSSQKGGARTHPQQHHPVPQGHPFSMKI